jgi:drug/metabolite transporter (DMT)-like permease
MSAPERPGGLSAELQAALLILCSTALFGIGDALVKLLSETWAVAQVIAVRSVFCLLFLLVIRRPDERLVPMGVLEPMNLLRSGFEIGVTFFFFVGVALMPLGTAVTIMFVSPILLTALAALFLGERVGWRRWLAVSLGFLGVLIIMRPGGDDWRAVMLLPLLAACCITGRDIVVRRLPRSVGDRAVVLATTLALLIASGVVAPFVWQPMAPWLLLGSAACALTVTTAFLCYVKATRIAPISFIQPFKYLALPYSFVLGFLVWGDLPDGPAIIGASLIVVSGLFILYRRRVVGTARPSAGSPEDAAVPRS